MSKQKQTTTAVVNKTEWWTLEWNEDKRLMWVKQTPDQVKGTNLSQDCNVLILPGIEGKSMHVQGEDRYDMNRIYYSTAAAQEWIRKDAEKKLGPNEGPIVKCLIHLSPPSSGSRGRMRKLGSIWKPPYQQSRLQLTLDPDHLPGCTTATDGDSLDGASLVPPELQVSQFKCASPTQPILQVSRSLTPDTNFSYAILISWIPLFFKASSYRTVQSTTAAAAATAPTAAATAAASATPAAAAASDKLQ
jgi:hypothetical protein